jgi:cytochrome c1
VGRRLDRETIRLWIVSPQSVRPEVRKPSYEHLSPERIEALIAYLESLAVQ